MATSSSAGPWDVGLAAQPLLDQHHQEAVKLLGVDFFARVSKQSGGSSHSDSSIVRGPSPCTSAAVPKIDHHHGLWPNPRSIWAAAADPSQQGVSGSSPQSSRPSDRQHTDLEEGGREETAHQDCVLSSCVVYSSTDVMQAASLVTLALTQPGASTVCTTFTLIAHVGPPNTPGSQAALSTALRVAGAARRLLKGRCASQPGWDGTSNMPINTGGGGGGGTGTPEMALMPVFSTEAGQSGGGPEKVELHMYTLGLGSDTSLACKAAPTTARVDAGTNAGITGLKIAQTMLGGASAAGRAGTLPAQCVDIVFGAAAAKTALQVLGAVRMHLSTAGHDAVFLPALAGEGGSSTQTQFQIKVVPSCLLMTALSNSLAQDGMGSRRSHPHLAQLDEEGGEEPHSRLLSPLDSHQQQQQHPQQKHFLQHHQVQQHGHEQLQQLYLASMAAGGMEGPLLDASILQQLSAAGLLQAKNTGGNTAMLQYQSMYPGQPPSAHMGLHDMGNTAAWDMNMSCMSTSTTLGGLSGTSSSLCQGSSPPESVSHGSLGLGLTTYSPPHLLGYPPPPSAPDMLPPHALMAGIHSALGAGAGAAAAAAALQQHAVQTAMQNAMQQHQSALAARPTPAWPHTAQTGTSSSRTRKADWVIMTEDTAIKNAAGAVAKVLGRVAPHGLCCPVFVERKTPGYTTVVSVAVKAIAVARGYVCNEGTGHEVGFQPCVRGDISACSYGATRPPGAPIMGSSPPPEPVGFGAYMRQASQETDTHGALDTRALECHSLAMALTRQYSGGVGGSSPPAPPCLGPNKRQYSGGPAADQEYSGVQPRAGTGQGLGRYSADMVSSPFGHSPPRGVSPPRGYSPPPKGFSPPAGRSPPPGQVGWSGLGMEVNGGSGGSSTCGDEEGRHWMDMEASELTFDVYKVPVQEEGQTQEPGNLPVKVTAHSRPSVVSAIIAKLVTERRSVVLITAGGKAMHIAMMAVVSARQRLRTRGIDILLLPKFVTVDTTSTLGWESVFLKFTIVRWQPTASLAADLAGRLNDIGVSFSRSSLQ